MNTTTWFVRYRLLLALVLIGGGLLVGGCSQDRSSAATSQSEGTAAPAKETDKKILYYRAPMDPTYISDKPGKSPMGMDLVPVYEGEEPGGSTIKIDPVVEQNMGVRTAPVEIRALHRELRALGRVTFDETKLTQIHTKVNGYIEKSYVNATGDMVKKGQALVDIYSPDLVATQEEYLQTHRSLQRARTGGDTTRISQAQTLLASARRRLEFWDISDQQITRLEETGVVRKNMTLYSPFKGVVIDLTAREGMRVQPGMSLYKIADLSTVWVESDVYEYELPWLKEGQAVTMDLTYLPGKQFQGRVNYVYPYLEPKTRTVKVRSIFANPTGELKPGMYADVRIQAGIGSGGQVAIPEESVIWSGERTLIFLAIGGGRFVSRDVQLGALSGDGYYQVLNGVEPGETVVTSGQFLLDSESKLKEAVQKMLSRKSGASSEGMTGGSGGTDMEMSHGTTGTPQDTSMTGMNHQGMQMDRGSSSGTGSPDQQNMDMEHPGNTRGHQH